ncbi:MAG: restriction endonuclease subunit S [Berryella intestinalis]|uniref:restriction endonuclease subunit S n=1 Tax=Berryella intestinalis TaxID=1531429 RepID=UPI002A54EF95|nr:restriction endonuclease subunit S [Berryella intestinalis]MDD7369115.1 restriction endonuclease subunit S [Berryella intestinalis]MDY3129781.1 restriction endonuclease subunit S [Berryella intestinalis]
MQTSDSDDKQNQLCCRQLSRIEGWTRAYRKTPAWEQRKLGEIIQLGGSGGTSSATNPNYYGGEIPFLGIADIEGRDIAHTAKTLTEEGLRNSAAWIAPDGAVSLAMYASVGKVGIIRQDTATSQAFYNMVFEDVAIRDFVFTRLEKADAGFEWEPYISTGTQRNLNADKVKAFAIAVPSSREAAKIGRYFANLDSLITLHQVAGCRDPR